MSKLGEIIETLCTCIVFGVIILLTVCSITPKNYDHDNIVALANNMYFEARNSTVEDQIATAVVVMNRGEPHVEVYKDNQFSWTKEYKEPADNDVYKRCYALATMIYNNAEAFKKPNICKHYVATSLYKTLPSSHWAKKFSKATVIGKHTYLCEK